MALLRYTSLLVGASATLFVLIGIILPNILNDARYSPYLWSVDILSSFRGDRASASAVDGAYNCAQNYTFEVLSVDPLVLYINNFLQESEINQLLEASKENFKQSFVFDKETNMARVSDRRTSMSAEVSPEEPVSQCIFERTKSLLGNMQHEDIEPLQVVKYEVGQRFAGHMDWFDVPKSRTVPGTNHTRQFNRLATIFAYLEDDCVGGETYFPRIKGVSVAADKGKFARTNSDMGLVVRARKGNALFWNNLHPNGTGDNRLLHGGATVTSGVKVGLNIFSTGYLDVPLIGGSHGVEFRDDKAE
ncbi:hypothetical protein GQ53DRAFT_753017 [Thozetella sp. PMI_491]|nr:hypothetical protein GQ53DRAFT_753017 [Thozetella sp. PMI_491]